MHAEQTVNKPRYHQFNVAAFNTSVDWNLLPIPMKVMSLQIFRNHYEIKHFDLPLILNTKKSVWPPFFCMKSGLEVSMTPVRTGHCQFFTFFLFSAYFSFFLRKKRFLTLGLAHHFVLFLVVSKSRQWQTCSDVCVCVYYKGKISFGSFGDRPNGKYHPSSAYPNQGNTFFVASTFVGVIRYFETHCEIRSLLDEKIKFYLRYIYIARASNGHSFAKIL